MNLFTFIKAHTKENYFMYSNIKNKLHVGIETDVLHTENYKFIY